jgi:hypothetical protein
MRPYLKKIHHKKGLMEWLKVKALSSNPRTAKKKGQGEQKRRAGKTKILVGLRSSKAC